MLVTCVQPSFTLWAQFDHYVYFPDNATTKCSYICKTDGCQNRLVGDGNTTTTCQVDYTAPIIIQKELFSKCMDPSCWINQQPKCSETYCKQNFDDLKDSSSPWSNCQLKWRPGSSLSLSMLFSFSFFRLQSSGVMEKGRPGRPWTPLVSDCKWCRTVNGVRLNCQQKLRMKTEKNRQLMLKRDQIWHKMIEKAEKASLKTIFIAY